MINFYQPYLANFLHFKRSKPQKEITRKYFLSFEDALWTLPGKTILMPNFYCMDVVENMRRHGLIPVFYPLDNDFQIEQKAFIRIIKKTNPDTILLFHTCGITSKLTLNTNWMRLIQPKVIIIEDCVHRLVNPEKIERLPKNYLVMDSLRKVSPIPGSFMYRSTNSTIKNRPTSKFRGQYFLYTFTLYLFFRVVLDLGTFLNFPKLVEFAFRILIIHDNIIGDSQKSFNGFPLFEFIYSFLDFKKVEKRKEEQMDYYNKVFGEVYKSSNSIYKIKVPQSDYPYMHVYPIGLNHVLPDIENYLHKKGAIVWQKFTDSPWSQDRGVLFLPLGFHISNLEIDALKNWILEYL